MPKASDGVGIDTARGQQPLELRAGEVRDRARGRCARARAARSRRRAAPRNAAAVRRSCHTIARWGVAPVTRSQATTVSRWFVMPIAATGSSIARHDLGRACRGVARQMSCGSCSTHPGRGKCCGNSRYAESRTTARLVDRERADAGRAGIDREDDGHARCSGQRSPQKAAAVSLAAPLPLGVGDGASAAGSARVRRAASSAASARWPGRNSSTSAGVVGSADPELEEQAVPMDLLERERRVALAEDEVVGPRAAPVRARTRACAGR